MKHRKGDVRSWISITCHLDKPSDFYCWLDGGERRQIQKTSIICCCTISLQHLGLTGSWGLERIIYTLFEFDHRLAVNQSDKCKIKYATILRSTDPFWDLRRLRTRGGRETKQNEIPVLQVQHHSIKICPLSANPLRWKPPDKNIMINKTAGENSSLEIKKLLFYRGGCSELSSHDPSLSPKTDEPCCTDYRHNCRRVTQHRSVKSQGIICLLDSEKKSSTEIWIWALTMNNVIFYLVILDSKRYYWRSICQGRKQESRS